MTPRDIGGPGLFAGLRRAILILALLIALPALAVLAGGTGLRAAPAPPAPSVTPLVLHITPAHAPRLHAGGLRHAGAAAARTGALVGS